MSPFLQLFKVLTQKDREAADCLAEPFGKSWDQVPSVRRTVEDIAIRRTYTSLRVRGESENYAVERIARESGVAPNTVRHRLRSA